MSPNDPPCLTTLGVDGSGLQAKNNSLSLLHFDVCMRIEMAGEEKEEVVANNNN